MPQVLNRHHNDCENAIYVGRPTKWGNPFIIGKDGNREEVIEQYRLWLGGNSELLATLSELRGRDLACWCAPKSCHAGVLLEMANR